MLEAASDMRRKEVDGVCMNGRKRDEGRKVSKQEMKGKNPGDEIKTAGVNAVHLQDDASPVPLAVSPAGSRM
jgi:hypothetical protein